MAPPHVGATQMVTWLRVWRRKGRSTARTGSPGQRKERINLFLLALCFPPAQRQHCASDVQKALRCRQNGCRTAPARMAQRELMESCRDRGTIVALHRAAPAEQCRPLCCVFMQKNPWITHVYLKPCQINSPLIETFINNSREPHNYFLK